MTPTPTPGGTATPSPAVGPPISALIYPTDLTIISTIDLIITDIQIDNVTDRLTDLHHGVTRSTNKLTVVDTKDAMSDSKDLPSDGKTMINRRNSTQPGPNILSDKRWGFFITGTGEMVDVESTSTARGSSFYTGGVTVGADYRLTDSLAIGAALGYANTKADLNFRGRVSSNQGSASIYATYYKAGFYIDGVATGGVGSIDTRRLTIGGFTRGNSDTSNFAGLLGTGYDCQLGNFTIGPVASLRFARAHLDSFHEGDAFGSLYVNGHDQDSLRSAAGLQAFYHGYLGRIPVTPMLRVQWQHEYLDDTASLNASFDNVHSFEIDGPRPGRNSVRIDAGLSAQISPTVGVFAIYSNELGRSNYDAQSISGGLRVSF
jgi:outer membrane autotransporter protein